MDDDRFPLSFMTEGQGSSGTVDIATVQWTWSTMGRMKFTDFVTYCNVTADLIAEDFGIFFRSVKVLSTGLGNVCQEISSQKEDSSRAYLATRGSFLPFIRAISGCVRMKSNISLTVVIQLIGLILGVLITATITLCSGVHSLDSIKILLYLIFWGVAAVVAPLIQKP